MMRGLSPWVGERQSVGEGGGLAGRHRIERCGRQDDVGDGNGPGITVSGRWDDASESSPDAVLSSIVGRPAAVQYGPTGNASGQRRVAGRFVCLSYQISSRSGLRCGSRRGSGRMARLRWRCGKCGSVSRQPADYVTSHGCGNCDWRLSILLKSVLARSNSATPFAALTSAGDK